MSADLVMGLGVALVPMLLLWVASVPLRNVSIVDAYWGPGFALLVLWTLWHGQRYGLRPALLASCVSLWGLRLGIHLLVRNHGHGEDRRYVAMRGNYGSMFWLLSLGIVFALQGFLQWLIAIPVQVAIHSGEAPMLPLHWLGLGLWFVGLLCESVADWQLAAFRKNPENRGAVMDRGLWRYSRHPNYFGDCVLWWGLFLLSWSGVGNSWTIVGPLVMTLFLLKVSGVVLLEKDIAERRPAYTEYIRLTSSFVPWPPKKPS